MSKPSNQRVAYHHLTNREEMGKTAGGSPFGPGNKVKVEWDFEDTDLEDLPYRKALRASGLPEKVRLPQWLVDEYFEEGEDDGLIDDWLSDEYGFTHHGWSKRGSKTAADEPTSVETVGALHFIKQIQRVADRTAGYKHKEDLKVYTDLDIKVIKGDWNEDVRGPSQPLYDADVKYKAKVYAVGFNLLGNPTLWESSGSGRIFSDPGGGFYFTPDGGVKTGNKGLDQIVRNSLDEAVYRNSGKITRTGSLHVAGLEYAIQSGPVLEGGVLKIPSQKGLLEIKPGNRKSWFRFTVSLNGKDISKFPSGWSTESDSAMHSHGRWDVNRKPEALGIEESLKKYTMLRKSEIDKIESWVYLHDDFRGLRLASTKTAKKRKAVYAGVMLSSGDQKKLASWWKKETGSDLLRKSYMHHMTIKFKPSPEEVLSLPIGDTVDLKVVGWAADDQAQAIVVSPSGVRSANKHPHVTVATDGTSPAYSNDLINNGPVTKVSGPTLKGRVGIFTGKDVQYDLTDTIYEEE